MTIMVDPQDIIVQMPPGSSIYGRVFRPDPHTDFYVREETKIIKSLRNPVIIVRPGVFYLSGIALVPVMFQIGKNPDQLFETWFNYYAPGEDGKKAMKTLITQDTIGFHFYGSNGQKVKSSVIKNGLQEFFRDAREGCVKLPPWSMSAFDTARAELYQQYPSPMLLWKKLGEVVQ
jgi:hypothetical protein